MSKVRKIIYQNIKGTPRMPYRDVLHDIKVMKEEDPDVLCLQEFKFKDYWATLRVFPPHLYGKYPKGFLGDRSSQPVIWKRSAFRKIKVKGRLLHKGYAGNTEARYLRAALLEDKQTKVREWFKNTHYLPRGASMYDRVWPVANRRDVAFTRECMETGDPLTGGGDYNRVGQVMPIAFFDRYPVHYVTPPESIDKVYVIANKKARHIVVTEGTIRLERLKTDHAGRWMRKVTKKRPVAHK